MFSLENKSAVVSGAGSGIGEAIARALAAAGASVCVLDLNESAAHSVAADISRAGGRAMAMKADVAIEADCREAAERILAEYGRCDVLVNNAGIGHVGTVMDTPMETLDRLYGVNVKGIAQMCRAFLPDMLQRRWGSVINIASIGGVVGLRERFAYCTTKFAVVGMTKCMALDHADTRVRFNAICPGRVETPFVQARLREYPDPAKAYREMASSQALNRMGTPAEIAASALYLAADESAFVTGSCLIVDGGLSAGK
jgi:NAD(P)-dependent dehydrogenase (short-subunit alcohol dehydrogenase family)